MAVVPFAISTSQARNNKGNNEELINMYANIAPATAKSQIVLQGTPGWGLYVTLPTYPILATHYFLGSLYCVTPSNVYSVDPQGSVVNLGNVSWSDDYVSIADNGLQMVMTSGNSYYYEKSSGTFAKITDPNYYLSDSVTFQDGYFIFNRSATGQFFLSRLYAVTFDGTMFATAEGSPDNLAAVISDHQHLWLMGTNSIEVWYNSGDALFPFARIMGSFQYRGCINKRTISIINNTLFWVGDDSIVYQANGYTPVRISTAAIEYPLGINDPQHFRAFTYVEEGHAFYVLTIDGVSTFAYDIMTQLWHTRSSLGGTWGLRGIIADQIGNNFGCDIANGNLYKVGLDYYTENGQTILRTAMTSPFSNGVDFFTLSKFELDMETGKSQPNLEDTITLSFSDDGGVTFNNDHTISLGAMGQRKKRVVWRRLGRHRNLTLRVTTRANSQTNIIAAHAELT